jgi:hypothetical protein
MQKPFNRDELAEQAGNWQHFEYYTPADALRKLPDGENWLLWYGYTQADDDCLNQCNYDYIVNTLKSYLKHKKPSAMEIIDRHWCGGILMYGIAIKVYNKNKTYTKVFSAFADMLEQMSEYPVLDDDDYMQRLSDIGEERLTEEIEWYITYQIDKKFGELDSKLRETFVSDLFVKFLEEYQTCPSELANDFPYDDMETFLKQTFGLKNTKKRP